MTEDEVAVSYSEEIGWTARGEQMIADYDEEGRVLGIELLGSEHARKPCQE